ncbi:hypothetical protein K501DRAFT_279904 [Backusella circina FSU 941]|nr:hypothetical protein K501DRAFT_279904 [Backusella circina FSU 941]
MTNIKRFRITRKTKSLQISFLKKRNPDSVERNPFDLSSGEKQSYFQAINSPRLFTDCYIPFSSVLDQGFSICRKAEDINCEIIQLVIELLHWKDVFECTLVCREWKHIVETLDLFRTIHVGSERKLNQLIKSMPNQLSLAGRVSHLVFDVDFKEQYDFSVIMERFPNICSFSAISSILSCSENTTNNVESKSWCQLEYLALNINTTHEMKFLTRYIFPNLTELSINTQKSISFSSLLSLLRNTRVLTKFAAHKVTLKLFDLERLHMCLPTLTSLELTCQCINITFPESVEPALSLTKVYITSLMDDLIVDAVLLKYIGKKYTRVQKLAYMVQKHAYMLSTSNDDNDSCKELLTLTESFGSQLTELSLGMVSRTTFPVNALNNAHCQLKKLDLHNFEVIPMIDTLSHSNLPKYIQELSLTLNSFKDSSIFEKLTPFTALKHLKLCGKIDLSKVLQFLGNQLESLELSAEHLDFDNLIVEGYPKYKLKKLKCNNMFIPTHLDLFISYSLPHLRDLTLCHCRMMNKRFVLLNLDLHHLHIQDTMTERVNKLLVRTLNDAQKHWYFAKPVRMNTFVEAHVPACKEGSIYPSVQSLPFDEFKVNSIVNLKFEKPFYNGSTHDM